MNDNGVLVIAWHGTANPALGDTDGSAVVARRYTFDGQHTPSPVSAEFLVNSGAGFDRGDQQVSGLAVTATGAFAIGYNSTDNSSFLQAHVRFYSALGSVITENFIDGANNRFSPILRTNPAGGYLVCYEDESLGYPLQDVKVRLFDESGSATGGPYQADGSTGLQGGSSLALLSDGTLVVV
jgi:hypothetical protein